MIYYDDNEKDGIPDDDALLDAAIAAAKATPDEVYDALLGLLGIIQESGSSAALADRRYRDAREVAKAYL